LNEFLVGRFRAIALTESASIVVDSNAGIAHHGISVDLPQEQVDRMITLNVQAVASLSHRFGKDMKERRRGRIMIVSSLSSMAVGIKSVAVYSATKAFERTLCNSLSLDLEPFGVGVTCLIPGAVRDTEFNVRSRSDQALVWRLPFCTCTAQQVAAQGVRAMLRGESEVIVGLLNRVFAKVLQPLLPQRLHNLVATIMWNPLYIPFVSSRPISKEPQAKHSPVSLDPRIARACRESDLLILSADAWTAERGWQTETGRFESPDQDATSPPPPPPPP
jgi:short-subunit dehydrogenase